MVLKRDLRVAIARLNPELPAGVRKEAVAKLTRHDFSRSLMQHNEEFHRWMRDGVPVDFRDANGERREVSVQVIDFKNGSTDGVAHNRFLAVREMKFKGLRAPGYDRRADLVCFVNGLPLVFIELKAVHINIRAGYENNLRDYMEEHCIAHAFHHNAFLIVSNGDAARYGSVTSGWEHFYEWKRLDEKEAGCVDAEVLLNGMLEHGRLLDLLENFILFDASKPGSVRKVVARNHQVLGVNLAVESVRRQEALKLEFPPGERLRLRQAALKPRAIAAEDEPPGDGLYAAALRRENAVKKSEAFLEFVEQAHPDLGKLGVFWHTQGSGKSYSMLFFTEKVRRHVSRKFTFLLMTDRKDLDGQLYRTFTGCGATVKLVYENRGEKLKVTTMDLNDRMAEVIEKSDLDADEQAHLEKLLGKDYEVVTADLRLDRIAADFVEHASGRWESGKAMLVCIDKITCARMWQRIDVLWKAKAAALRTEAAAEADEEKRAKIAARATWMEETVIELIISEAQNEVADFKKWNFDIIPHRARMKNGFETPDGKRVDVESAFKDDSHPFRIAIVCAMWLTGFDVECLSTLYLDKPMKAHTLMQAIARANRVYPGKDFGLIVDYNGMLKSLRAAFAKYALGDDADGEQEIITPVEDRVVALLEAIEETEAHLAGLGFDCARLAGAKGFPKIKALRDAVEAIYTSDEAKRRFEIMARQVFSRFKALVMEPSVFQFSERHDNIEAIYKKLTERRDLADVTEVVKALHRIVNAAIATDGLGEDQSEAKRYDLSMIDLEKLRDEFAKVPRKATAIEDIRKIVEDKLRKMMERNPERMDFFRKYTEIVAEYNHEKDRVTMEETFAKLMDSVFSLLPSPPFSEEEKKSLADHVFRHLWQQYMAGRFSGDAA